MATVNKRERKLADGSNGDRWEVRYFDRATGRRPAKTFKLKKDADAFAKQAEREIEDGTHVTAAATATIAVAIEQYLKNRLQHVRDGRITDTRLSNIHGALDNHVKPHLGGLLFKDLTPERVEQLYADLTATGRIGAIYARNIIREFHMVEQFAARRGLLKHRPVQLALKELRGIATPKIGTFTIDDVGTVLRSCLEHTAGKHPRQEFRTACMIHLAACCGMRLGEILALDLDHVDLDGAELIIRRSLNKYRRLKGPKSVAGNRNVPMPPHLVEMLRKWLAEFYTDNTHRLIFTGRGGDPIQGSAFCYLWYQALKKADLFDKTDPFHFHALRHFAGSWWLKNGMQIPDVTRALGHSDPSVTMRVYIHSLSHADERSDAMRQMGTKLISGPKHVLLEAQATDG